MPKFRKLPVVVEAVQWHKPGDHPEVRQFHRVNGRAPRDEDYFWGIDTFEGTMHVQPGDWIITGVHGEHYPCKPDVFAETYEPA